MLREEEMWLAGVCKGGVWEWCARVCYSVPKTRPPVTPLPLPLLPQPKPPFRLMSKSQYEEDEARVLLLLAEALVRSPWASRWVLKVWNGRCGVTLV